MKRFTNCTFLMDTEMVFGKGVEDEAGRLIKKYGGSKVLLVYGGGSIKKSGLYERVSASLREAGLAFAELAGVKPNPRRSRVEDGVKIAFAERVDFILAVGGGSVIDTAKALALALAHGGEYWSFYNGKSVDCCAPIGTINTIAAAGSETSCSSVIVDDIDTHQKKSLYQAAVRPCFAILNPELTYTVSAYQTGAGAADILAHSVQRYFCDWASNLGDEYAEGTMRSVVKYGPRAVRNGRDYEARRELLLAAPFSHNDLTYIGREGVKGGEHALESEIAAHYDTAHGAGLAVVMPAWLQYIADTSDAAHVARIAQFGVKVFGVSPDMEDVRETANEGLRRFRAWLRSLGMPLTFKELGIPSGDLDAMVQRCMTVWPQGVIGWVNLDEKAVRTIFGSVME
jgi:alcohol dehydrogenase YqhD (iron-dependent ADH family)